MARILIAEHNAAAAEYMASSLKKAGNSVISVNNSLDAWRVTGQDAYDVLVIDVVMPGIDSFVLAQKALQDNPSLQIVFVTGFAAVAMDTYATPCYAPAPITTRPFHLKQLAHRVRYLTGESFFLPLDEQEQEMVSHPQNNVIYADFAHRRAVNGQGLA